MLVNGMLTLMLLFSAEKPAVSVLCYHAFRDSRDMYSFTITELRSQIEYFRERGYSFVSYEDIVNGRIKGRKNILITVDDGNKTVYTAYHEVFKPNRIKPIIAIYPAVTGKEKYALTWEQARELSGAGCTVAAHGYHHLYVNSKLHDKDFESFKREIYYSKKVLQERLGINVGIFIYPYGSWSPVTVEHLKKAGYSSAFTTVHGQIETPLQRGGIYELPRYIITRPSWKGTFAVIDKKSSGTPQEKTASGKQNPLKKSPEASAKKYSPEKKSVAGTQGIKSAAGKKPALKKNPRTATDNKTDKKKKISAAKSTSGAADIRDTAFGDGATQQKKNLAEHKQASAEKDSGLGLTDGGSRVKPAVKTDKKTAPAAESDHAGRQKEEKKTEVKKEHVEELKKTYSRLTDDSYKKYGNFNDRMNSKLKNKGSKIRNFFNLNREKPKSK